MRLTPRLTGGRAFCGHPVKPLVELSNLLLNKLHKERKVIFDFFANQGMVLDHSLCN